MAKGKHSTALFEVINRPARSGVLPPPVVSRAPLTVPSHHSATITPPGGSASIPAARAPSAPSEKALEVDRDRHQISLRVSYTSALVTLFAVLVVVGLAYLVGRGGGGSPSVASASTEEIKKGPANPSVLNVSTAAPAAGTSPATASRQSGPTAPVTPLVTPGPVAAPTNVKRIIGQNYVIMQSYPPEEEATAKEAQRVLLAHGIPCTVEKTPRDWGNSTWFSVIGTHAFNGTKNNTQFDGYIRAVKGAKFAENSKFKKLDPAPYKWK